MLWAVGISYIAFYRKNATNEKDEPSKMWMFCDSHGSMYVQLGIYIGWALIGLVWNLSRAGQMFGGYLTDANGYAMC